MVAVQSRLDDVLLALKGKKVEATHQVTRTIPSICTEDGKSQRITIDVSDEGERELEKLDRKFKAALLEAGKSTYGRIGETRAEARAAKPKKKKSASAEGPSEVSEDEASSVGEESEQNVDTEPQNSGGELGGSSFGG